MRKRCILCLTLASIFVFFTACNKTPVASADFSAKAAAVGFTVQNMTGAMEGKTVASLIAVHSHGNFQIEFHEFETRTQAENVFSRNRRGLEGIKASTRTTNSASAGNWGRFAITSGGVYGMVSHIGNTVIYARVPQAHRETVQNFVKEIGY
ncbi:MAG: hypothetical protein LBU70_06115 [Chitinispirillales bacterium]|jgi:hypothetical protein|nr:hypothetical protein [Chitinispirillales bacterium]